MTHLTRDVLIKSIVAEELSDSNGIDYIQRLKNLYHKWEHESSEEICRKYNQLNDTNITVTLLSP